MSLSSRRPPLFTPLAERVLRQRYPWISAPCAERQAVSSRKVARARRAPDRCFGWCFAQSAAGGMCVRALAAIRSSSPCQTVSRNASNLRESENLTDNCHARIVARQGPKLAWLRPPPRAPRIAASSNSLMSSGSVRSSASTAYLRAEEVQVIRGRLIWSGSRERPARCGSACNRLRRRSDGSDGCRATIRPSRQDSPRRSSNRPDGSA
jgi:hypothetical protein